MKDTHHIIEVPEKAITKYIPKELAFCNPVEFRDVAMLLYNWQCGDISYLDFRVQAIYKLLNLKKGKRKLNDIELDIAYSNIEQLSTLLDTFFDITDDGDKRIKLNLIENPLPYVRPILSKIYGPKKRFTNTVWGQYEDASNSYHMYYRTQDNKYLYELFATYYQDSTSYSKLKRQKKLSFFKKTIDFSQVFSFFLFFEAFQNYVTSSKVIVEGQVIDLSILFSPVNNLLKSNIPGLGTKSLSFQIAESGVFGSLKELRSENLWEIFLRLYDIRKRDLDAESEAKKQTTN